MNLDKVYVGDIETDGLLHTLTKLHVFSFGSKQDNGEWLVQSTRNADTVKRAFSNPDNVFVIHNGLRFDKPALEKIFGFEVKAKIIDSLALAWWLLPKGVSGYGLADFGERYGVPKPVIEDWEGLTYEEYAFRCSEDVKINIELWEELLEKGRKFYSDKEFVRLINLLNFIMECSYHEEEQKVKVDVEKTRENLSRFELMKEDKVEKLKQAMPKTPIKGKKKRPARMFNKFDVLTKAGEEWVELMKEMKLPLDTDEVEIVKGYKESNPNSPVQKKAWLYSLGWEPCTYKYIRDKKTNTVRKVEQILDPETKMLTPSVLELIEKEPAIEHLDGLTVLTHRIGVLNGFLENMDENEMIAQGLGQLAVTMRWQHKVIVNIPKVTSKGDLRDGQWLRECLIANEGTALVQADLSGVESRTSDHYTFKLNPDRIVKTQQPFFDPHTEISVVAQLMTEDEEAFYVFNKAIEDMERAKQDTSHMDYKDFSIYPYNERVQKLHDLPEEAKKKKMKEINNKRSKGKTTNYASLYLVGAKTLSRNLKISQEEAQGLIDAYWEVHWAVKKATESFKTKTVGGETWIYNPVSRIWYYLRNEKDKFSVVNQSTAVYCFNKWVYYVVKRLGWPITQTHDDLMLRVEDTPEAVDNAMKQIKLAMEDVNEDLKLNVKLDCEVQTGHTFAETH